MSDELIVEDNWIFYFVQVESISPNQYFAVNSCLHTSEEQEYKHTICFHERGCVCVFLHVSQSTTFPTLDWRLSKLCKKCHWPTLILTLLYRLVLKDRRCRSRHGGADVEALVTQTLKGFVVF